MLYIRLVGKPRLERDGVRIEGPRGHKAWALLARLVRSQEPVSRERLVDELFAEANDPMGALRWSLAEIRRRTGLPEAFLGNPIVTDLGDETIVDVVGIAAGDTIDGFPEGRFLEGIEVKGSPGFESWLTIERQRVDGEVLSGLRQATLRALSGRSFDRAVDLAGAMVRRAPFEEGTHVLLVKALAASGDAGAAERQVLSSEEMFLAELGVQPTAAIRNASRPNVAAPVPGVSSRISAQALLEAGLAAVSAGAVDAGIECLRRAASDADESGDNEIAGRCLLELGTALVHSIRGYDDEGAVVLHAAIAMSKIAGSESTAAKAMSELGYVDLLAGRRTSASSYLDAAQELAGGDPSLVAAVAGFQAMNLSDWGKNAEACDRFSEALELSRSAGAKRRETWTLGLGSRSFLDAGRLDEAGEWARLSCRLATEERWTAFRPWPEAWLAQIRLAQGEQPLSVRDDAEATFALARQLEDPCWEGVAAKVVGLTYVGDKQHDMGLDWMVNAGTWCLRVTDPYRWVEIDILLAETEAAFECGDLDRAEAAVRKGISGAARGQMDGLLERGMTLLTAIRGG